MKFVAVEDIAAPVDRVWPHVADFEGFQRLASRRTGPVTRTPPGPPGAGTAWTTRGEILGRTRDLTVILAEVERPNRVTARAAADGMSLTVTAELSELAPGLTRLTVTTEAAAQGLAARLMLHSAGLARQTLAGRYATRVLAFADAVEATASSR